MIEITIQNMIDACRGTWQGDPALLDARPGNIVTDSRQAGPGSLFIALKGERTDGHKYIPDVLAKGALAVLCQEPGADGEPRIVVPDVMRAMREIAAFARSRCAYPFIGVTGSVGKTTAKEMIAAVLSARLDTFKTPGSMNGQIGLPVTFMALSARHEAAVIEMGVSQFGEMTRLTEMVHPDYAVFTNIGDAHLEFLHDREGVLRAKSEIVRGMKPDAVIFANGDDALLKKACFGRKTVLFGLGENCTVRAEDLSSRDGISLQCTVCAPGRRFAADIPAYGEYIIYSVLAAAAVGMELGLSDEEIARGLKAYNTVGHRSRVVRSPLCTLIDDCYNANPTSNRAAIDSMVRLPGRKVCFLGDMREMGETSPRLHREIGEYAVERGVDLICTYGEEAKHIAEGAGDRGRHFTDRQRLLDSIEGILRPGDVVLVKASHGPNFVDIVEKIEELQKKNAEK